MFLEKIYLQNFKNHADLELKFSKKINFIAGLNGSGKTNLLDAIHYLSLTKSAFNNQDALSIKDNLDFFAIQGWLKSANGELFQVLCSQARGQKKNIKVNHQQYDRLYEHIGRFPVVMITPFDNDLVREGSEGRRKFFDTMISQVDQGYLALLMKYNHFLKQRNGLLKLNTEQGRVDMSLIEIYDQELLNIGGEIYGHRKNFMEEFETVFKHYYQQLTQDKEQPTFEYQSQLTLPDFEKKYKAALQKDLVLQRTTMGVHKDDFLFSIKNLPLKTHGSQGQQKSYVIALKLANYAIIKEKKNFFPLLLLDDIFEKLDEERILQLLTIVGGADFGQLFITDARVETSEKFFANMKSDLTIFNIRNESLKDG